MSDEKELDGTLLSKIDELCRIGDAHLDADEFNKAQTHYEQAWALLPEPNTDWEAATWIQAAIADAYFFAGWFVEAQEAFRLTARCPNGIGNPFLHLRRGQVAFELGDLGTAGQELTFAYMGEGRQIFEGEDTKYFDYLKTILEPPVGQQEL